MKNQNRNKHSYDGVWIILMVCILYLETYLEHNLMIKIFINVLINIHVENRWTTICIIYLYKGWIIYLIYNIIIIIICVIMCDDNYIWRVQISYICFLFSLFDSIPLLFQTVSTVKFLITKLFSSVYLLSGSTKLYPLEILPLTHFVVNEFLECEWKKWKNVSSSWT